VRIVLIEADGSETEFRFAGWKENVEMSDSRFQFTPPAGVETVEGELGP
jgi:outer membrane lipoprotein-sorting protein